ncbi:MAG: (d)CMP kinase, partial [Litorimonas sp.]
LSGHYNLPYLDTGKLYRAAAKAVLDAGGDVNDANDAARAAMTLDLTALDDPILKSGPIGEAASKLSIHPQVRNALLTLQRDFAAKDGILDGRDIGTVICPDATVKIYVTADAKVRAQRRYKELLGYGEDITYETVLSQLHERDNRDMNRKIAPLRPAEDAHLLDTSELDIDAAFLAAVRICDAVMAMTP